MLMVSRGAQVGMDSGPAKFLRSSQTNEFNVEWRESMEK
jgi:hypothetical protein